MGEMGIREMYREMRCLLKRYIQRLQVYVIDVQCVNSYLLYPTSPSASLASPIFWICDTSRSAQALEIISLIFYIIATILIIIRILDLDGFPFEISFMIAVGLLFICSIILERIKQETKLFLVIFLSTSLRIMSDQSRKTHPFAFLDWAQWNGLVGLIMTIISVFSSLALIAYTRISDPSSRPNSFEARRFF